MAKQAREAMGTQELTAIADRGYFNSEEILVGGSVGGFDVFIRLLQNLSEDIA
jgi:hypothetical protein